MQAFFLKEKYRYFLFLRKIKLLDNRKTCDIHGNHILYVRFMSAQFKIYTYKNYKSV